MNLDLFKNSKEKEESIDIKKFANELKQFIEKPEIEDGIYQVVDFSKNGVFLQNAETNQVFECKNIPEDLKKKIGPDYILRCENGKLEFDKELTDEFFNNMVDIKEFIKKKGE